ncbi:hypothetical protein GCM10008941_09840 [Rhizomicrobium palustre]
MCPYEGWRLLCQTTRYPGMKIVYYKGLRANGFPRALSIPLDGLTRLQAAPKAKKMGRGGGPSDSGVEN